MTNSVDHTATAHTALGVLEALDAIDGKIGARCFRCLDAIKMPLPGEAPTFAVIGQVWHGHGASLEVPVMTGGLLCGRCRDSWRAWCAVGAPRDGAECCPSCGAWDHAGCVLADEVSYARAT